jgi:hypothetical protein
MHEHIVTSSFPKQEIKSQIRNPKSETKPNDQSTKFKTGVVTGQSKKAGRFEHSNFGF